MKVNPRRFNCGGRGGGYGGTGEPPRPIMLDVEASLGSRPPQFGGLGRRGRRDGKGAPPPMEVPLIAGAAERFEEGLITAVFLSCCQCILPPKE
jgi:hypothetical protein